MAEPELQSLLLARSHNHFGTKRPASEEPDSASDAKQVKTSHEGEANPDIKPKATEGRVPFPDKASKHSPETKEIT